MKLGSAGGPGAGKSFSNKTKKEVYENNPNCVFCGVKTTSTPGPTKTNIDHAIAKRNGGNNSINNAQTTCQTCNQDKRIMSTAEYIKKMGKGMILPKHKR